MPLISLPIRTEAVLFAPFSETPEAIKIAVPYIQEILNALGICIMVKEGYEADDIIGTLAKKAEEENFETYMVTPDKDFAQLVNKKTFIYKPLF